MNNCLRKYIHNYVNNTCFVLNNEKYLNTENYKTKKRVIQNKKALKIKIDRKINSQGFKKNGFIINQICKENLLKIYFMQQQDN